MKKESAGILMYRRKGDHIEVLLAHPGGPFWKNKDAGAWTIPKGEINEGEDTLAAALREAKEELGMAIPGTHAVALSPVKLKSGKVIHAWAMEMDMDPSTIRSNSFDIEWPPKSGQIQSFPEIDRAVWFDVREGMHKINAGQVPLLLELKAMLAP